MELIDLGFNSPCGGDSLHHTGTIYISNLIAQCFQQRRHMFHGLWAGPQQLSVITGEIEENCSAWDLQTLSALCDISTILLG